MIECTENLKDKNMIALLYASGLRRSELLSLKLVGIDYERNVITVRQGKGKKDRQTTLAENLKDIFSQYILEYKPKEYTFEGQWGGMYSGRSLEEVIKQAAVRAEIKKMLHHTHYDIVLQLIYLKIQWIFGLYKNYWDIVRLKQPNDIRM